jgi:hypothetical protein
MTTFAKGFFPQKPPCKIEGCGKAVVARGWCENHYRMWRHNGDPLVRGTAPGEAQRYLEHVVMPYDGDGCLIWPFAKSGGGYGAMQDEGQMHPVSRIVCIRAHGPPPTPRHEAAHSCGRGHLGCVAKRHVSWKTAVENTSDKHLHGTVRKGTSHPNAKLTEADVREILRLNGEKSHTEIAAQFGIGQSYVSRIVRGEAWGHLSGNVLSMELLDRLAEPLDGEEFDDLSDDDRKRLRESF